MMGMAIFDKANSAADSRVVKTTLLKKMACYLVQQWQRILDDRQQLWRAYGESVYARGTPRCVWRRHGALLVYAKYRYPVSHKRLR